MEGQFCHSFCTYSAVGSNRQFQSKDTRALVEYFQTHKQVKDLLCTGGDPMVMLSELLHKYVFALLDAPGLDHLSSSRIGSKSVPFWPSRYVTDRDAKEVLDILMTQRRHGKTCGIAGTPWLSLVLHVREARYRRHQLFLSGRAYSIFSNAYSGLSELARTVRGPSVSASPGKVGIIGIDSVAREKVFILRFIQAHDPAWIAATFLAKFDEHATWLDELVPAFGDANFFYEDQYQKFVNRVEEGSSGQLAR